LLKNSSALFSRRPKDIKKISYKKDPAL